MDNNREVIINQLKRLANAFEKKLNTDTIAAYVDALEELSPTDLIRAVDWVIDNEKFFPRIATLKKAAYGNKSAYSDRIFFEPDVKDHDEFITSMEREIPRLGGDKDAAMEWVKSKVFYPTAAMDVTQRWTRYIIRKFVEVGKEFTEDIAEKAWEKYVGDETKPIMSIAQ